MESRYYKLLNDVLRGYNRATPTKISNLRNNQIFVFGTDKSGSQRSGAAGLAAKCFGAEVGVTAGPTGMCYALPTMGFTTQELAQAVSRFEKYVRENLTYTFLVTSVGCGHAGFNVREVADMFKGMIGLRNVMLPELFLKEYRTECNEFFAQLDVIENMGNTVPATDDILLYFDERVHDVVEYLINNQIPFNREGGFSLKDENGIIIAEAELGIEPEKIVFYPFGQESERAFTDAGFTVMIPSEYLNRKK